jgi:hypothetical protein
MTDFSAVVVHQNEPCLGRALASIERQTLPARELLLADPELAPVHRAINEVAGRVRTPYFIQVDADMVLDPDCFARLRGAAEDIPGVVIAQLRDPLVGRIGAIKLFPTDVFDGEGMPSTISPDADFARRLSRSGRRELHVLRFSGPPQLWHTLGEHAPDYTPAYAFGRYYVQGERYLYRGQPKGAWALFQRLQRSDHPAALCAQIGMTLGIFSGRRDGIRLRPAENPRFLDLEAFLARPPQRPAQSPAKIGTEPLECFERFHDHGQRLQRQGTVSDLLRDLEPLTPSATIASWFCVLGLFRGLLDPPRGDVATADAAALLAQLQP